MALQKAPKSSVILSKLHLYSVSTLQLFNSAAHDDDDDDDEDGDVGEDFEPKLPKAQFSRNSCVPARGKLAIPFVTSSRAL